MCPQGSWAAEGCGEKSLWSLFGLQSSSNPPKLDESRMSRLEDSWTEETPQGQEEAGIDAATADSGNLRRRI